MNRLILEPLATRYLVNRPDLSHLITEDELVKAGIVALLTERDEEQCLECNPEAYNVARIEGMVKVFGRWDTRRLALGVDVHPSRFVAGEGSYISWVTTGGMFWNFVKDELRRELCL